MGFSGYFAKVGNYIIPNECIEMEGYNPLRGVTDHDSYRDGDDHLHRNVSDHDIHKIEINLRSMTNKEFDVILSNIQANYTIPKERKAMVTCFIPEHMGYVGPIEMYMPDPEIKITKMIDSTTLKYAPVTIKFIEY